MDELRARIRHALRQRGLSAHEASIAAGLNSDMLRRILSGAVRQPSSETCRKLARFFGWDVDEVLALAGHRTAVAQAEDWLTQIQQGLRASPLEPHVVDCVLTMILNSAQGSESVWMDRLERAANAVLAGPLVGSTIEGPMGPEQRSAVVLEGMIEQVRRTPPVLT